MQEEIDQEVSLNLLILQREEMKIDVKIKDIKTFYEENKLTFDKLNNEDLQKKLNEWHKFTFGNFDHLYNPTEGSNCNEIEDRLSILPEEWFKGKKVLDVGCNDGTFTLALTLNFSPDLVIGVDIDNKLISRAIKNIHLVTNDLLAKSIIDEIETNEVDEQKENDEGDVHMKDNEHQKFDKVLQSIQSLPRSLRLSLSLPSIVKTIGSKSSFNNKISKEAKDFLYERLSFRTENFIANIESVFEKYDVIICIKTIKWIHLNFGDVGVKALFHKAYESLEPNGLFIFDSPHLKSYKKRRLMNESIKKGFQNIVFKPAEFDSYLKHEVGFKFKTALKSKTDDKKDKRPLLVYIKSE